MARSSPDLLELFSESNLRTLADYRSFDRGLDYADIDCVYGLKVAKTKITATVYGSRPYDVRLGMRNGEATYSCSCPVGFDGAFCKHCVAVGLLAVRSGFDRKSKTEAVDVKAYLESLEHHELVKLVLDVADGDGDLARRLHLDAVQDSGDEMAVVRSLKTALDDAFSTPGYVEYREAYDFAAGIDDVIDSIERVLRNADSETAVAVADLAEYAYTKLEESIEYVDDSSGYFGGISEHVAELHIAACRKAKFEPEALAERLFHLEVRSYILDTFRDSAITYKSLLKKKGLAHFRALAEKEWTGVPSLGPDDERDYGRSRVTHMMETLAEMTGDVDVVVDVLSKDLSSAWRYVGIVEKFREAKRFDDALDWAERGIEAFGPTSDSRLVEIAADEYLRAKRSADAVDVAWQYFDGRPDFSSYERLCKYAKRGDDGVWEKFRNKALRRIRSDIKGRSGTAARTKATAKTVARRSATTTRRTTTVCPPYSMFAADASTLVEIFLWEGDIDAAWKEAKTGGCTRSLWMELAAKREKGHPLDAIPIYQDEIESTIAAMSNDAYSTATKLTARVGKLMKAAGQPDEFDRYVADVRTRHKPKRNLMKLFADRGWLA